MPLLEYIFSHFCFIMINLLIDPDFTQDFLEKSCLFRFKQL